MQNNRGVSLLEIVVSVAIMSTVLLFLSSGFVTSMYMTRQSDEYSAAARAAREKMEEIVSQTIMRYDRQLGGSTWNLVNNPTTGQLNRVPYAFPFTELPDALALEFVGGRMAPVSTATNQPVTSGATVDPFGRLHPFRVYLSDLNPDNPDSTMGLLPGLVDDYAGEVVCIVSERMENFSTGVTGAIINTANQNQVQGVGVYAGDLQPRDGTPDGFNFFRLPIDLNGDGDFNDSRADLRAAQQYTRFAIGVIVRWNGKYGPERHETWTVISRY